MPSPKIWKNSKRTPPSPISNGTCMLSPKDITLRTGFANFSTLPVQKSLPYSRSSSALEKLKLKDSQGTENSDNQSLGSDFVWHKKLEKDRATLKIKSVKHWKQIKKRRATEQAEELLEIKRRREEREAIRHELRQKKEEEIRSRQAQAENSWAEQEEMFFLKQVPLRSQIRIEQGRAKPIDLLARYIIAVCQVDVENIQTEDPLYYITDLSREALEDLSEDINTYMKVHNQPCYQEFWMEIGKIVNFTIDNVKGTSKSKTRAFNTDIEHEIKNILKGKNSTQLNHLKQNVLNKLKTAINIDVAYWDMLLEHIETSLIRQRLLNKHENYLKGVLKIFQEQKRQASGAGNMSGVLNIKSENFASGKPGELSEDALTKTNVTESLLVFNKEENKIQMKKYNVEFLSEEELPNGVTIIDANVDRIQLQKKREMVLGTTVIKTEPRNPGPESGPEPAFFKDHNTDSCMTIDAKVNHCKNKNAWPAEIKTDNNTADEFDFNDEIPLEYRCEMEDLYKPQKPRYFNKVQTGYFWNRYNRTHYDSESPPPKMVLGYKFNIYYPDLIDKTITPRYTITRCKYDKNFSIIRFIAGPPYEDIAFRIVNDRDWDRRERLGFRNWYRKGVLELWFRFRKMPYRR